MLLQNKHKINYVVDIGMARKCCVKNCEINGSDVHAVGIPIHRFPKDQQLKCKWLKNAGFSNNYKPLPGQFVCFRHFCKNDYEKVNKNTANSPGHKFLLKKGSVPTIFDNYENHPGLWWFFFCFMLLDYEIWILFIFFF